ncbi:hypothetical protein PVAP13_5KG373507 [Panicum virgatum]|uniref:DUF4220 domain-containing protein n=1 Tax=Panicum virgatum TaxID=38727 RepID=A0A8T0SJQ0_PANVG|nr:hypothetical protein PVAP13_5KG373507 [Panicum virgatum]
MRMLRNPHGGVVGTNLNHLERWKGCTVGQFWNDWEMHILVFVSFAMQVFMFLFTFIRKRNTALVQSVLLWPAYVSADAIAIFVLGRFSLHINGTHHRLTLFWAPFMLLHLGGQETITAFSMEGNMLWKRHLLTLVTQVGMAAYVVGKQWQGEKQLLAPMVLMFFSGTLKYAERTYALMRAAKACSDGRVLQVAWSSNIAISIPG